MDNENLNNNDENELNEELEAIAPWYKRIWHGAKKAGKYVIAAVFGSLTTLGVQKLMSGKDDDENESNDENDNQGE